VPKVSIIVTTFNRQEYLTQTIHSILNQTYQDFELIVVDNYSSYDFFSFIESFRNEKIIPLQNQNNGIIAANRNIGIRYANGEYIAFCDDDDIWVSNKLEEQIRIFNESNCDLVYTNMFFFKGDTTNILKKTSRKNIYCLKDLINRNQINTSTVLVRNNSCLVFPEDELLITIEDYALWLNLYMKGFRFKLMNQPLVYFRISELNTSNKNWEINHIRLIYLHTSILIRDPKLKIKKIILTRTLVNFLKFVIKNILMNRHNKKNYD
jgi:glycosyltransferase involved in cell wall biosynthesis